MREFSFIMVLMNWCCVCIYIYDSCIGLSLPAWIPLIWCFIVAIRDQTTYSENYHATKM